MTRDNVGFRNPIIAAQTFDFPFVADPYLGHTMPAGREFLGEKHHISMDDMITEVKKTGKKSILNIGDSSTSGWDSNIVTQNRKRHAEGKALLPAFFQYETYSDYLRSFVGAEYIVINAGVPAHTSLQGSRRIKLLLDRFQRENIPIQWVTVYYGNNDSVWDHNRQDRDWIVGKKDSVPSVAASPIITRVMPDDYKSYVKDIMETCYKFGSNVIIIEPVTPIYWKPGTRVLNEELDRTRYPGSDKVYQLLDEARALWAPAIQQHFYSDLKRVALEEAREKDFVVPRIKRTHLAALRKLAHEARVPYLQIEPDRTQDDIRYFVDYCHPIGEVNRLIASKISSAVSEKGVREKLLLEKCESSSMSSDPEPVPELPTDHYTLY